MPKNEKGKELQELPLHERLLVIKRLMRVRSVRFEVVIGEDDSLSISRIESESFSDSSDEHESLERGDPSALIRLGGSWFRSPELGLPEESIRRYVG